MFKSIFLALALILIPVQALAIPTQATGVKYPFSGGISGTTWTPVIASTTKVVKGITVLNTSSSTLELGINLASAASSGDVRALVLPATANQASPNFIPLSLSSGYRISIRNLESSGTFFSSGYLMLNALYD